MKTHLDQTLKEAVDRMHGDFATDIEDYDMVHHHILKMADLLSGGIVKQFRAGFGSRAADRSTSASLGRSWV